MEAPAVGDPVGIASVMRIINKNIVQQLSRRVLAIGNILEAPGYSRTAVEERRSLVEDSHNHRHICHQRY